MRCIHKLMSCGVGEKSELASDLVGKLPLNKQQASAQSPPTTVNPSPLLHSLPPLPPSRRSLRTTLYSTAPRAMIPGTPTADICPAVSLTPPIPQHFFLQTLHAQLNPSLAISTVSYSAPIKSSPRLDSIRSLEEAESSSVRSHSFRPPQLT